MLLRVKVHTQKAHTHTHTKVHTHTNLLVERSSEVQHKFLDGHTHMQLFFINILSVHHAAVRYCSNWFPHQFKNTVFKSIVFRPLWERADTVTQHLMSNSAQTTTGPLHILQLWPVCTKPAFIKMSGWQWCNFLIKYLAILPQSSTSLQWDWLLSRKDSAITLIKLRKSNILHLLSQCVSL